MKSSSPFLQKNILDIGLNKLKIVVSLSASYMFSVGYATVSDAVPDR